MKKNLVRLLVVLFLLISACASDPKPQPAPEDPKQEHRWKGSLHDLHCVIVEAGSKDAQEKEACDQAEQKQ